MHDTSAVIPAIVVTLLCFLIFRHIVCWYWKINYATELLENILHELKKKNGGGPL